MQHGCREIQVDRLKSRSKFKVSAYYRSFRYVCCWSKFICASSNIFLARCLLTWIFYRDEDSIISCVQLTLLHHKAFSAQRLM